MKVRLAALLLILGSVAMVVSLAQATVIYPEYLLEAEPIAGAGSPSQDRFAVTVLIRQDIPFEGLELGSLAKAAGVQLIAGTPRVQHEAPAGYRRQSYEIQGVGVAELAEIGLVVLTGGERVHESLVLADAGLQEPPVQVLEEVPRIDPRPFPRPLPSPRLGLNATPPPGPQRAPRTVTVTGRILFRLPDGTLKGAYGATVKVMEPVAVLDDNTLGEAVTDINGDVSFNFSMDGTKDIYVKVEPANGTAVNVGTGLFFRTYARTISYNAFAGTSINLGSLSWTGNFNSALWLAYAITWARDAVASAGYPVDRVHVRFPDDSQPTSWYSPVGGFEGLHIRADRAFRTSTIYHEFGHHFVYQRASAIAPAYCNDLCDYDGTCGHCYWCEENEAIAWSEGFPHWIAYMLKRSHLNDLLWGLPDDRTLDYENIQVCADKGTVERGMSTEGIFTSFLIDLVDENDENDPAFDPVAADRTRLDPLAILHVATVDRPSNSYTFIANMRDYIEAQPGFTPLDLVRYWSTVRNNGLDEDTVLPTAPTSANSPTHAVNVQSAGNMPVLLFSGGTDDFSGVQGHYVTMTPNNPATPDGSGIEFEGNAATWPVPLAPGTWYANIRSVDGAGNRSANHLSYGPMLIAPPVPIDLVPTVDYLWEDPLVVRNSADATPTAAGYPAELLPGTGYLNLFFANQSPSGAAADTFRVATHINGNLIEFITINTTAIAANEQFVYINRGPFNIPGGGRYRFTANIDAPSAIPETDEENNKYGVSLVVKPPTLTAGAWQAMPRPPHPEGGAALAPGTPDSEAGHRFTPLNGFGAVLVQPDDPLGSRSLRLRAYQPSSGPLNGFTSPLASATYSGVGRMVVAKSASSTGAFDFGVHGTSSYRVRAVNSVPRPLASTVTLAWNEEDWLSLLEFDFGPGDLGYFNVSLSAVFDSLVSSQWVNVHWIAESEGANALGTSLGSTRAGDLFTRHLSITAPGKYALAIRRNTGLLGHPTGASIQVSTYRSALPEVSIPLEYPDIPGGFVPTLNLTQGDSLSFPLELLGDATATYINFAITNVGAAAMPAFNTAFNIGTEKALTASIPTIPAESTIEYRHPNPFYIQGGRRVLSLELDPDNLITELSEGNNVMAMQWGWTGTTVFPGQPLIRPYPPDPTAWLGSVPQLLWADPKPDGEDGEEMPLNFTTENCDGVRLDPSQAGTGICWHGVAVMPVPSEDIDLRLFQGGVPAALAYVDDLAGSHSGVSESEFALVNLGAGAQGVFDAGVYSVSGTNDYAVHAAAGVPLATPVGSTSYGSYNLPPGMILNLYEMDLVAGTYDFDLLNQSQVGSVGMSVHPPLSPRQGPWHGKDDLQDGVQGAQSASPGSNVSVSVQVVPGAEGKYCLAVWKPLAVDLAQGVPYSLSATGTPSTPLCITIDGTAEPAYGPAKAVQQVATSFGDSNLGLVGKANGSELDQAFGKIADGNLYLAFTGNLESNLNDLEIFLDAHPGGQNRLLSGNPAMADNALGRMGDDGSGNGFTFDLGFEADFYISVSCGETPVRVLAYGAYLLTGGGGDGLFLGAGFPGSGGLLYGLQPGDDNGGIRVTLDNSNTGGVSAIQDSQASPQTVTTGVELVIPLDAIGNPDCVRVTVFINGQLHDFVSNQFLPSLPEGTSSLGDPRTVDLSAIPGPQYFDVCAAGAVGVGGDTVIPPVPRLLQPPMPNPFTAQTSLSFTLHEPGIVNLAIFDIRGRRIRNLTEGVRYPGGTHSVVWNGRDDQGGLVAAGVYHVRFRTGEITETRRLVFLR